MENKETVQRPNRIRHRGTMNNASEIEKWRNGYTSYFTESCSY